MEETRWHLAPFTVSLTWRDQDRSDVTVTPKYSTEDTTGVVSLLIQRLREMGW